MLAFSDSVRIFQQEGYIRIQQDPGQAINRLNASYFSHFQAKGHSQGHSLKFVASGKEQYQVDQAYHQVKQGQFLLVPHESPVEISISASQKVTRGFCLYFSPELINDIHAHLSQGPEDHLECKPGRANDPWLSGRFESRHHPLHQQLNSWYQHFHEYGFSQEHFWDMAEAIVGFQREAQGQLTRISTRKPSTAQELLHRLHRGQAFIHDSYTRKITIHDMAEVACLSPFHFTRTFKAAFGTSPYQYVQYLRIQKAMELLRNSDRSITEIAYASGYSDIHQFSKAFKQRTGFSPTSHPDFRRN
ncbi:MAG: helix-turn-helix transcriptional regulator [Bacteroidota bacterium]